jgi:hypothetical protein
MMYWTKAMTDKLIAMRADGKTFGEIAVALGVTRCAVAGKVSREKIGGNKYHVLSRTHGAQQEKVP